MVRPVWLTVQFGQLLYEMRKINQNHCASVVTRMIKNHLRAVGTHVHLKKSRQSTASAIHKWRPHVAPATHLKRRMGTAQSTSSLGNLKATRKRHSCQQCSPRLRRLSWQTVSMNGYRLEKVCMLRVEVARPLPVCAPNSIAPYPEFVEEIIDVFVGLKLTKCKIISGNFNAHPGYDAGIRLANMVL